MNRFAVTGLDQAAFNIIGGWEAVPAVEAGGAVSFGGTALPDEDVLTWQIGLPADGAASRETLAQQKANLEESQALVALAGQRMRVLTPDMAAETAQSFSAGDDPVPALELMETLAALQGQTTEAVSFGLIPGMPDDWRQTVAEYMAFSRQMLNLMKPALQVETRVGRTLLAVSRFQLDGDAAHSWPADFAAGQTWQHGRTVRLTLQTRMALFQLFAEVSAGAIALAPRFIGGAGTALLALPATYKFVKSTVAQFKKLRTLERQLAAVQSQ